MKDSQENGLQVILQELKGQPGAKFVELLLESSPAPLSEIRKAIRIQKKLGNNKVLSSILVELGIINEDEQRRLIRRQGRSFRMGELVCELGYIELSDLHRAESAMGRMQGKRMGEILIELGMINDRQVAQALSEQLGLALMHVDLDMIDRELVSQFSIKFLRSQLMIPFDAGESHVSVITADPLNEKAVREIEGQLNKKANVFIAARGMLTNLVDKLAASSGTQDAQVGDQVSEVVDSIFLSAIRDQASDIHLEPMIDHMRVRFRMDGVLIHKMDLPAEMSQRIVARIKVLAEMDISNTRTHQDGRISRTVSDIEADFRLSSYVTIHGENLVMRVLRRDGGLKSIEQIHMSRGVLERFKHGALDVPTGVIIITGPTGSGKTTTLYAAVDYLNRPTTKIITLEDPVEYVIDGIMQCSVDVQQGRTFSESLKAVVRQDPDIIVLGEIRDKNSA
ncbi:MAG: ATPase, T2SS/T4P/T4SS family, partial [Ghiorsea sp.]